MWMIAGLGNPEKKYVGTRHNTGFAVINDLLEKTGAGTLNDTKFNGAFTKTKIGPETVLLVKPLTYMNESGKCIAPLANFYRIPPENIIVISDDINLEVGRIRIRPHGSAGGHNGLKSIIACLGTDQFPRVRVGVGAKPDARMDLADHVLGRFSPEDEKKMQDSREDAADACYEIVQGGVIEAMNLYNGAARG